MKRESTTKKRLTEEEEINHAELLNWFTNSSILLDMVKRTAIDTAEAIVKRELGRFYDELCDCVDCLDCQEEINEQKGGDFKRAKNPNKKFIK